MYSVTPVESTETCVSRRRMRKIITWGYIQFLVLWNRIFCNFNFFFIEECVFFKFRIYQKIEFILSIQCSCKLCIYMYPTNLLFSINMLDFLFNIENKYRWVIGFPDTRIILNHVSLLNQIKVTSSNSFLNYMEHILLHQSTASFLSEQ